MPGQGYPAALISKRDVHPEITGTLCASGAGLSRPGGMGSEPDLCVAYECRSYALQGNMIGRADHNGPRGSGVKENVCHTITATDVNGVAAAYKIQECDDYTNLNDKKPTDVSAVDCRNYREIENISGTLQSRNKPGYSLNFQNPVRVPVNETKYIVRRLTPTECERLQGFPDGWTKYGHDSKEISDTRRYQMLGNSVAIPCVAFVLGRVADVEAKERR
jgi:DNA (cytosine-5)-methyltransferase 1